MDADEIIDQAYEEMRTRAIALGRECCEDPTCKNMERQGRPLTNVEMHGILMYREDERRKATEFLKDEL